ncbi:potassium channel subfamily K member 17 isoform X2 [Dermochelys coriacea]|uniref:potassium channel subfamily K member 17 isoform X2 n=1 Tax=Dermochelys coriacea TaxID=27794 RepID=UPI001CA9FC69|nr:potassium channel subfamily K member 17 isoform X2 [Dermochelys coriacea]
MKQFCLIPAVAQLPETSSLRALTSTYLQIPADLALSVQASDRQMATPEPLCQPPPQWHLAPGIATYRNDQGIIKAYKSGLTLQRNSTSLGRWDFVGSFFFSVSAITTIGYGNLSPSTVSAQIFCIFFALFGIPLNLILLNRIGQLMLSGVQQCTKRLGEKLHWQEAATILTRTCALVTGLLLFLLLPPFLFSVTEGWTYEEGFYYSFITLSTIGFGDL